MSLTVRPTAPDRGRSGPQNTGRFLDALNEVATTASERIPESLDAGEKLENLEPETTVV